MSSASEKPDRRPAGRQPAFRVLRAAGLIALALAAVYAAVVAVRERQAEESGLKQLARAALHDPPRLAARLTTYVTRVLPSRTTFSAFLETQGLQASTVRRIIQDCRPVYNLASVRAGNEVTIARAGAGDLRGLTYQIDPDRILRIQPSAEGFQARIEPVPYKLAVVGVNGTVHDSLIGAVEEQGEQDTLALAIADIFGWDFDFNTDTQPGDTFSVLVEKKFLSGVFSGYGRVLAAQYVSSSRIHRAVLFHTPEGRGAYYAPDGKAMQKAFLRSPLRFAARVTSRFSYHRYHPILKRYRPHLGIDYGAPVGSAVQAVADGTVEMAGWSGGSGREVRLRHAMGYETFYLHLSRIVVRPGQHVSQGQLIAYTGATGLATGPHLDFRIEQHGRFRNFLALNLPPASSVARRDWGEFSRTRDKFLTELASLRTYPSTSTQQASTASPGPALDKGK